MRIANTRVLVVAVLCVLVTALLVRGRSAPGQALTQAAPKLRWDMVNVNPDLSVNRGAGTALAEDGSRIVMTGGGTFNPNLQFSSNVTGGGTWETQDASGNVTGNGRYQVEALVRFELAPGTLPCPPFTDNSGKCEDTRAGLVFLSIGYSDGSKGVLVVSCHLAGTPDSVFEGITASKGFVDFWRQESGETLYHELK